MNSLTLIAQFGQTDVKIEALHAEKKQLVTQFANAMTYVMEYLFDKWDDENMREVLQKEFFDYAQAQGLDVRSKTLNVHSISSSVLHMAEELLMIRDGDPMSVHFARCTEEWKIDKISTNPFKVKVFHYDSHERFPRDPEDESNEFIYSISIQINDLLMVEEPEYPVIDGMLNEWYDQQIALMRTRWQEEMNEQKARQDKKSIEKQISVIDSLDLDDPAVQAALKKKLKQ